MVIGSGRRRRSWNRRDLATAHRLRQSLVLLIALAGPAAIADARTQAIPKAMSAPSAQPAQLGAPNIIGTWSTTLYQGPGVAFGSIFVRFGPDGRYHKRTFVRVGTVDTVGSYRFDPQQSVLYHRAEDYAPKTIQPIEPIGQWISVTVQFLSPDLFITHEGTGSLRWVRQP
jgi:hypothetical protein